MSRTSRVMWALVAIILIAAPLVLWRFPSLTSGEKTADSKNKSNPTASQLLVVDYSKVDTQECVRLVRKYYGATRVTTVKVDKTSVATVKFDNGSMHPLAGDPKPNRLWSLAVNVPLRPQTLEAERSVVCHDPAQAAMVMNGLGRQRVGNHTIAELNPWMQAQGDPRAIQAWAQRCADGNVNVHLVCAKTMAATSALLALFHEEGVQRTNSTWNYELAGLTVGHVPPFRLSKVQEHNAYFLVASVTSKTEGCVLRIGFNVGINTPNGGDQRLAGIACNKPAPKPKPTAHKPPTKAKPPTAHKPPTKAKPPRRTTKPPTKKTCITGPGYLNCRKSAVDKNGDSVIPPPPTKAPGKNPAPAPKPTTPGKAPEPTSGQCYDGTTGNWVPYDPNNPWCS